MCGIYFCYHRGQGVGRLDHVKLNRRGLDATQDLIEDDFYAIFYRLAIVGVADGMQPFDMDDCVLLCNGEIYNHLQLEEMTELKEKTHSDCECILHLYSKCGIETVVHALDGEFAFILYDRKNRLLHFARDRLGRKPLFYYSGMNKDDESKIVTMELASLHSGLSHLDGEQVLPGYIYTYDVAAQSMVAQKYHTFVYKPVRDVTCNIIFREFKKAVEKRIKQSERPVGFLLSGGFDSSLVLSMALSSKLLKKPPHVFTIGFEEKASDVIAAEQMVIWLKKKYGDDCIIWHKVIVPIEEGIKRIPEVIGFLETYDTTTIRASTPMYLISEYIAKTTDVRVILSGEGSDELFGGYLYFRYAPNDVAFRAEILSLLNNLYLYDVLRADRATAAHSLEIRTPFLDDNFVTAVLFSPELVRSSTTTKELIRRVVEGRDLLPEFILHGKKEAFSDAVGLSWKDSITRYVEKLDIEMEWSQHIEPKTKEEKWYQSIFATMFSDNWYLLPRLWLPNQTWVKTGSEPSARVLPVYSESG
jgi:asparagine synthase (glutamine-hydrolysing)